MTAPPYTPTPDPVHRAELDSIETFADQVRYACTHADRPVTVATVRAWLAVYGIETGDSQRPYISRIVNGWRREQGLDDTSGSLPVLTPELLADLDAATVETIAGTRPAAAPAAPEPVVQTQGIREARAFLATATPGVRRTFAVLGTVVALLLTGAIVAPIALSSKNIIGWADSDTGLGLDGPWPLLVFAALDAAAAICVLVVVLFAMIGRHANEFRVLVWVFALTSAFGSYQYGMAAKQVDGGPQDAWWLFPLLAVAGPLLLELTLRRVRQLAQEGTGRRSTGGVAFPLTDWLPGIGATRETYGAWRLARLDDITDAGQARRAYRALCPTGSVRVLRALRERDAREHAA